ncbi:selenocysteine-specific translation elongation factor [bacterium]|nr:selenocysteine-specific translation elongation factor [bacterium]
MKQHVVIGTAGHIDHGKTALVKALTDVDTDRLVEEKARGMTIDLGFAPWGEAKTIIDVPGHEKFIRNMVAGVSSIDLVLFVVAADDGIMPQTIEHLEILNLLQIRRGLIVITKKDLVEPDWLELVQDEILELVAPTFLKDSPVFAVSSLTGDGIPELSTAIQTAIRSITPRPDKGVFRLPIDRIFSIKGFGTIAAGTVLSGQLHVDETVELLPQQVSVRVRGLQQHSASAEAVKAGDRAAINLAGIEKNAIKRGDVLATPGHFSPALFYDAQFYLLKSAPHPVKHNARVRLHIGTSEVMARIRLLNTNRLMPGETAFVQLQAEDPVTADYQDRFVVRSYSPMVTIGGGKLLQVNPPRHKRNSMAVITQLELLAKGELLDLIAQVIRKGKNPLKTKADIAGQASLPEKEIDFFLDELVSREEVETWQYKNKNYYVAHGHAERLSQQILVQLAEFHAAEPLKKGVRLLDLIQLMEKKPDRILVNFLVDRLRSKSTVDVADGFIRLADHHIILTPAQEKVRGEIEALFLTARFSPPVVADISKDIGISGAEKIIVFLIDNGSLVMIEDGFILHAHLLEEAEQLLRKYFAEHEEMKISDFRDITQTSRKYAVPLLNYFDEQGLVLRQGDVRVLNEM